MNSDLEQRLWSRIDIGRTEQCWPWLGSCDGSGYGRIRVNGRAAPVHRVVYELENSTPLGQMWIDHMCHNRLCCNPAHLRPATCKQNNENQDGAYRSCKSGLRGVYKQDGRWRAQVYHNGRKFHAGYYATANEAAEAARLKRLELFTHNDPKETAHV